MTLSANLGGETMFTGIIQQLGEVLKIQDSLVGRSIWFKSDFTDLTLGESIAIDGCCLTVTEFHQGQFRSEMSPETLELTTASAWGPGRVVNLERALRPIDFVGGHFVTGHIDGIARIANINLQQDYCEMTIALPSRDAQAYVIPKGSIAINGVSLTINQVAADSILVMLIPHTLAATNLSKLQCNDTVNIEYDMLTKVVAKQFQLMREIV
ncbi:MAG: riboflavin synthase [Coxiellaceae bacterium]|nr:MAG: riboflavin synthase [Coxiellaceae bacterium]